MTWYVLDQGYDIFSWYDVVIQRSNVTELEYISLAHHEQHIFLFNSKKYLSACSISKPVA
jgi:hypothetical protein